MKNFICIAKCPELDHEGLPHCKATEAETNYGTPTNVDFCPCGNRPVWKMIDESEGSDEKS